MKFTEGYWLRSEKANALYASQAFSIEQEADKLRVVCPVRPVHDRGGALDVGTLTLEFSSAGPDAIAVRMYHFAAYQSKEPRFALNLNPQKLEFSEDENSVVMTNGNLSVRVWKGIWGDSGNAGYQFERNGVVLSGCHFRNAGYFQWGRTPSTMLPDTDGHYLHSDYKPYMNTELSLAPDECVYGMGERWTSFVKNGQTVDMWNEDGGTASQVAYKNIPFYITNKNYGVFVDHSSLVSFEAASEKVEFVSFSVPGEELRYVFIAGDTPKAVLANYTDLTGKPALPPVWSFGLWLSTSFTTNYDEATTSSFIQGMADRNIPLSVFHFDCYWMKEFHWCDFAWDKRIFPDIKSTIKKMHERGLKVCCWLNPYVAQDNDFFREGAEKGYFLMRADGHGIKQVDNWQPGLAVIDFTNPLAYKWYADKLRELHALGIDAFKSDFGERIPVDVVYHNGLDPMAMHNYYAYLYNKVVFDTLEECAGEGNAVLFARSATAGCQQFPVHWGGDNSASYPSMAETLRGGLSFMMSGFGFWSNDIGGFEATSTPDLYKRWVQFGLFCTHSRLHGSKSYRVPWNFDEESSVVLKKFVNLKCRLMPYIWAGAVEAHKTGIPLMRPMQIEFAGDRSCDYLDRQYMLGSSILVAPIFNDRGEGEFFLPYTNCDGTTDGAWVNMIDGERLPGGRWHTKTYDYLNMPVFVRPASIIPFGKQDDRPDYDYTDGTEFRVYDLAEGKTAQCTVHDLKGNAVLTLKVSRKGDTYEQVFEGAHKNCTVRIM
ncbi:MAG: alpha-xylosidase [Spirochaetaceae bacterium]|jgi:alpha-D-xyloside xylohydrolase|nr:alpha-xylosidase [Spirochaetaceae bacterium]